VTDLLLQTRSQPTENTSRTSLVLITMFLLLIVVSIAATFYNTMVLRDFVIINDIEEELE
jgi:hypothetical protein